MIILCARIFGMRMCIHSLHAGISLCLICMYQSIQFFDPILLRYIPCEPMRMHSWHHSCRCEMWSTVFRDDQLHVDQHTLLTMRNHLFRSKLDYRLNVKITFYVSHWKAQKAKSNFQRLAFRWAFIYSHQFIHIFRMYAKNYAFR